MITKRQFIAGLGLGLSPLSCGISAKDKNSDRESYADADLADQWMQEWITRENAARPNVGKAPNGALHVGRFADPFYYLTSVIGWDPEPAQEAKYKSVRVPIGFVTDFASIPRLLWPLLRPDGLYSYAAIVHDYLYWEQYESRLTSDRIFKYAMRDFEIEPSKIEAIYRGVRIGGWAAWNSNREKKERGERRILKLTPKDPTIRWSDWKSRDGVFG